MTPVRDSACKMPTEAEEDWMMAVSTVPTSTPSRGLRKAVNSSAKPGISRSGSTAPDIISMPYISTVKPTKMVPTSFFFWLLAVMVMTTPIMANTREKCLGLSSCITVLPPWMLTRLSSQAVMVVPMLAPMMTPTVCPSAMMPEFTRPTSMTVTAEEDWITAVTSAPSSIPFTGLAVMLRRMPSSLPPASFSRPWDMTFMPYRKNARPPPSVSRSNRSIRDPPLLHLLFPKTV